AGQAERDPTAGVSPSAAHAGRGAVQQLTGAVPLSRLHPTGGRTSEVPDLHAGAPDRLHRVVLGTAPPGQPRSLYRLVGRGAAAECSSAGLQPALSHSAVGAGAASGFAYSRADGETAGGRLATLVWTSGLFSGNLRRFAALPRHLLSCGQLDSIGLHHRAREQRADQETYSPHQGSPGLSFAQRLPATLGGGGEGMKPPLPRLEVSREELQSLLEHARNALSEPEYQQLKAALDTLVYLTQL